VIAEDKICNDYETELMEMFNYNPFEQKKIEKSTDLTRILLVLTKLHYFRCKEYKNMMQAIGLNIETIENYEDIPFLPVRLFKKLDLKSILKEDIFKIMTSSGTSGQAVSKIYLDRKTAGNQQKVLTKIVSEFTGSKRMPMLIIDNESTLKNRNNFSARGAGILGFSIFGTDRTYALNGDMELDVAIVESFLERHKGEKIFLFGFTFMIWKHFYKELVRLQEKGHVFDFSNGVLIHGGGWKKLQEEAVSSEEFKRNLGDVCGLKDIHDYYGMVEQTGCIYMECECGHLHASIFSDVLIRNPRDFSLCKHGERGLIQVVSVLPASYPGHSLLTEDEGIVLGEDDCACGRKGKYFKVLGRLKNAELRGCSDTYASNVR
jgi:phenylacetate-coenzyme A ligase PaaK-like adenylate-forming protein